MKNPKERSTAILVGVAAGAILMALMFMIVFGLHTGILGNVLDKSYDNVVAIDIDAQRTYLESRGMDTSEMDDIAVAKANTGTKVFIASNVKFVNAMEDLKMNVNM